MSEISNVSADELRRMIDSGETATIVDVLSPESFARHHIPGAISIPIDETFREAAASRLPDRNARIIVYCSDPMCLASPRAAEILVEMGYANVAHFAGGIKGWEAAGFPTEP